MGRFVINMDERSLDTGKYLDRILKLLANIVCFPQRCACSHDDVDLNEVVWAALMCGNLVRNIYQIPKSTVAYVVRADGIDLFNLVAEHHRLVNEKLNEIVGSGSSGQQFKFSVDPIDPSAADAGANLQGGEDRLSEKNQGTITHQSHVQ